MPFNDSSFIREGSINIGSNGFSNLYRLIFNVLPVSLKRVNKIFNECVNEFYILIVAKQIDLDIHTLSSPLNGRYLKQVYLIQSCLYLNDEQINSKVQALNHLNFACLEMLQVHFYQNPNLIKREFCTFKQNISRIFQFMLQICR